MLKSFNLTATAAIVLALSATTFAQNSYDVNATSTPPTIDGVVSAGEWDAASAAAGGWRILRDPAGPNDTQNNRFRMLFDDTNLYILYETDFPTYRSDNIRGEIRFGYNNINFFFDPNLDDEGNQGTETMPFLTPDSYQIAINMYLGTFVCESGCSVSQNTGPAGLSSFAVAFSDATTGNNLSWLGMRGTQIGTVNGNPGGVMELAIPWTDFDAPGLDDNGEDPGLNLMGVAPVDGDQWNFNAGFISSNQGVLPVWNWSNNPDGLSFFVQQPAGVLNFVAADDEVLLGDVNLDNAVNFADIAPFIALLSSGEFQAEADVNEDTLVNFGDISIFIGLLSGS